LKEFRSGFLGKVSPVHFFWGSFDDDVRAADSPRIALMEFLQSTYDAAADTGHWDRKALER
jgi:hypothetical protein